MAAVAAATLTEARVFRLMLAHNLARDGSVPERMDEGLQLSHFIALTRSCVHVSSTHGPLVAVSMTPHMPELLMLMLGQILQLCRDLSPANAAGTSGCSPILVQQHEYCTAVVHSQQHVM